SSRLTTSPLSAVRTGTPSATPTEPARTAVSGVATTASGAESKKVAALCPASAAGDPPLRTTVSVGATGSLTTGSGRSTGSPCRGPVGAQLVATRAAATTLAARTVQRLMGTSWSPRPRPGYEAVVPPAR